MAKKSKQYLEALNKVDRQTRYPLKEAIKLVQETSFTKFDATVDMSFRLNLDPRKAEQNLRGAIVLPHGTGKVSRVLVIAKGDKAKEAADAGADYVGDAEYLDKIKQGWFEFDVIVATPDMMGELGKLGRVLGPKGLMPNPKTGTVTTDVAKAVQEIKAGKVEYRVDKAGNIHFVIGKVSFDTDQLYENAVEIIKTIVRSRPSTVKGYFVKNLTVASTMGPGIKVAFDTFVK